MTLAGALFVSFRAVPVSPISSLDVLTVCEDLPSPGVSADALQQIKQVPPIMSAEPLPKKCSAGAPDTAGLKASIVKAIFNDLSPSRSPSSRSTGANGMASAATSSGVVSGKKSSDFSLSENDLTITDEVKTPSTRAVSENGFLCCKKPEPSTELRPASTASNRTEVKATADSEPTTRGPSEQQLAWLKACRTGDVCACKKLLKANPDLVHYVPPFYLNYSAVHIATLGRHYEVLRLLKKEGANLNAVTKTGYTPLHLAAQNQDSETVRVLIGEFGVDTKIHDLLGYTYEHYADWLDHPRYDCCPLAPRGAASCNSSRQPSIGSQESLASSKNSFSRHGSMRDTIRELLHIPTRGVRSRSPSLTIS